MSKFLALGCNPTVFVNQDHIVEFEVDYIDAKLTFTLSNGTQRVLSDFHLEEMFLATVERIRQVLPVVPE